MFLGVGKNFRLLMQSCCFFLFFFSPDLFMKISNFSKTVHTIFTKLCTVILHPEGPLRVTKTSKSYGWDVRNIAKIIPKIAKKQPFFEFFQFSQKLSVRFERTFLQLFYTILESYMCNGIKTYGWDVRNIAKISPKKAKKRSFFDFFSIFSKTVHTIRTKFSTVILHHIRVLYLHWH